METARRFLENHPSGFSGYVALQCALMRRYVARGGSDEEFCEKLAPVFRRKYAPLFLEETGR